MRKYVYYLQSIFKLLTEVSNPLRVIATFLSPGDRKAPSHVQTFRLRGAGLEFAVRGKMDLWSVKEAFLDRFYEKNGVPVGDGWTVVDIGAGIGEFTLFAAHQGKQSRVFAFEPFPESYRLLLENLRANHIDRVQAFHMGVWSESGKLALDLSPREPLQLKSRAVSHSATDQQVLVDCISLEDLFRKLDLEKIDLMKLDCEGAEYPILYSSPKDVFDRIDRIVMEYHDSIHPNCHPELVRFLEAQGYQVRAVPNLVHKEIGYLYASQVRDPEQTQVEGESDC